MLSTCTRIVVYEVSKTDDGYTIIYSRNSLGSEGHIFSVDFATEEAAYNFAEDKR